MQAFSILLEIWNLYLLLKLLQRTCRNYKSTELISDYIA